MSRRNATSPMSSRAGRPRDTRASTRALAPVGVRLAPTLATALLLACSPPAGSGGPDSDRQSRTTTEGPPAVETVPVDSLTHRGVCWVAGPHPISGEELDPLVEHGVTWISQTPFGWQDRADSPELSFHPDGEVWWGERDDGLETTTRLARERGIRTLLKPHIWIRAGHGGWSGDIAMRSDEDWEAWFGDYRRFILHYAGLAEDLDIAALAVGTELRRTVVERPDEWRRLISEIRDVYSGELTYAANWYREYEAVPFWDALDFVGIQAYFPLASDADPNSTSPTSSTNPTSSPTLGEIVAAWQPRLAALESFADEVDRPIVFTELGYRSVPGAAVEPWVWPERRRGGESRVAATDVELQSRLYEAFFEVFWDEPWFEGVYFWKWYPRPGARDRSEDFTPQGKPAAEVMKRWFTSDSPEAAGVFAGRHPEDRHGR